MTNFAGWDQKAGDAWIPSLEPFGLARVPGYDANRDALKTEDGWRKDWFDWREALLGLREKIVAKTKTSAMARDDQKYICSQDIAYEMAIWGWIHEPRARSDAKGQQETTAKPYAPFAFQVRDMQDFVTICEMEDPFDRFESKARGLGVSWNYCWCALHGWRWRQWDMLLLSRKEELVDKPKDMRSLFVKMDFMLERMPSWWLPKGFNAKEDRMRMLLKNPENGAQIAGESTSQRSGRGGRFRAIIYDEAAFMDDFELVLATGADSTDHRFGVSTESFEKSQDWYNLWSGLIDKGEVNKVRTWDYWHNPYHDKKWFRENKKRAEDNNALDKFEREVERKPRSGSGDWMYPEAELMKLVRKGYNPTMPLLIGIDPGHADDTAFTWMQLQYDQTNREGFHFLDCYERNMMPVEWFAHLFTGIPPEPGDICFRFQFNQQEREIMRFFFDLPWGGDRVLWFMDPAGSANHVESGSSFYDKFTMHTFVLRQRWLAANGGHAAAQGRVPQPIVPFFRAIRKAGNLIDDRRNALRPLLVNSTVEDNAGGRRIKHCLLNRQFSRMTNKSTSEPKAIHNAESHVATSIEYAAMYQTFKLGGAAPTLEADRDARKAA